MPKRKKALFYIHPQHPKNAHPARCDNDSFCVVSQGLTEFCQYPETTLLHPVKWYPSISFLCSSLRTNKKASFCVQQANNDTLLNKTLLARWISPTLRTSKGRIYYLFVLYQNERTGKVGNDFEIQKLIANSSHKKVSANNIN